LSPPRDPADAKAWFYLDHRLDIETWAALRQEGRQLLDRCLVALSLEMEDLAEELGAEPDAAELESGSWPRVGLRHRSWQHQGLADVSVVIQWERARLLTASRNEWPFVGILIAETVQDQERRSDIAAALGPVRSALKGDMTYHWPFWRYVTPPATAQSLDPAGLARQAVEAFRQLWDIAAAVLDQLHSADVTRPER
jgi:hypothetical protein